MQGVRRAVVIAALAVYAGCRGGDAQREADRRAVPATPFATTVPRAAAAPPPPPPFRTPDGAYVPRRHRPATLEERTRMERAPSPARVREPTRPERDENAQRLAEYDAFLARMAERNQRRREARRRQPDARAIAARLRGALEAQRKRNVAAGLPP